MVRLRVAIFVQKMLEGEAPTIYVDREGARSMNFKKGVDNKFSLTYNLNRGRYRGVSKEARAPSKGGFR
ncbi:hypothetical protein [Desulfofundulus salinus]|uniref:Uncharacterized protein n=1 Tax=Desulfofundulus salinus TaxID=2419843 RepID=A0A494WTK7_9FIRM|nr:hypothetical protein [Desulfofundulus salinum]RKO66113.1 hypothetical protein D7024_03575 [Desulfofundulus salinum]